MVENNTPTALKGCGVKMVIYFAENITYQNNLYMYTWHKISLSYSFHNTKQLEIVQLIPILSLLPGPGWTGQYLPKAASWSAPYCGNHLNNTYIHD